MFREGFRKKYWRGWRRWLSALNYSSFFENMNTLEGPTGRSQWRVLHLTVQHEPIVFSHRSASRENCEQNPSMWPRQIPHLQPRREFFLHLNHDRENLMMGRGGGSQEVENVQGGGEGVRKLEKFLLSLWGGLVGLGWFQEIQLLLECFLSKRSLTHVRISTAPYYSFSYGLQSFTLIRSYMEVGQWWMTGLGSVTAHCSGFLTLRLAFIWFLSSQFSVAH